MVRIHFTGPPQEESIQVFLFSDSVHARLGRLDKDEPILEYNMNEGTLYKGKWALCPQIGDCWLETRGRHD